MMVKTEKRRKKKKYATNDYCRSTHTHKKKKEYICMYI